MGVLYYFLLFQILFPFIYPVIDKQFSPFVTFCSKHVEFNQDGSQTPATRKICTRLDAYINKINKILAVFFRLK